MLNKGKLRPNSLPVTDYKPAIAKAVGWLGDRYVLPRMILGRVFTNQSSVIHAVGALGGAATLNLPTSAMAAATRQRMPRICSASGRLPFS